MNYINYVNKKELIKNNVNIIAKITIKRFASLIFT